MQGLKMFVMYAFYVLIVIFVSLFPSTGVSFWHIDKIGHFFAYAGMAVLALLVFNSGISRASALFFAVALGAALEWGQSFVPGRDMSLMDGIANTLGVITGTVLFWFRGQQITRYVTRFTGE
jgi:VanZ family protein